jgi:hypothetical protein
MSRTRLVQQDCKLVLVYPMLHDLLVVQMQDRDVILTIMSASSTVWLLSILTWYRRRHFFVLGSSQFRMLTFSSWNLEPWEALNFNEELFEYE